jgi:biopolymer transport protein ExbB
MKHRSFIHRLAVPVLALLAAVSAATAAAPDWWKEEWTGRTKFTLNPAAEGAEIQGETGEAVLLVRLHPGNLAFELVQPDGSDLRFVTPDGKVLPFHLEKFDPLMAEGFAWVRVPAAGKEGPSEFFLYYGNAAPEPEGAPDPAKTYPENASIVYHLNERGTPPQDATTNASHAASAGNISEGTIVADGLRLVGRDPISIPGSPANAWSAGGDLTLVFWVKPISTANEAILFSRPGAGNFRLGLAAGGAPFFEVDGQPRAVATETVADATWRQVAVTASGGKMSLYLDGREVGAVDAPLPAGDGIMFLGGPDPAVSTEGRLLGEFDELQVYTTALSSAQLRLMSVNQSGAETAGKVLSFAEMEGGGASGGHGGALEHVMLFGDIANNMMFDGWIAVAVCVLMMIAGWWVAGAKYVNLGKIEKGNAEFQKLWSHVAADLTAIDLDNPESAKTFGGQIGPKALALFKNSPLYHVYHVGSEEIRHRLGHGKNQGQGLSARSIQAIRASLDAALVHEQHRLNKNIVYLTVSIAGGPYVGLLGTVVGVMITFAIIAKSGEVDVNSIAPGIASALLATTVGLLVAIPALFMYSFLNQRIKGVIASMQVFIDEFVAKVAEFYPPPGESGSKVPIKQIRTPEEAARFEETGGDESAEIMAGVRPSPADAPLPTHAPPPPPPRRVPMPPPPAPMPAYAAMPSGQPT